MWSLYENEKELKPLVFSNGKSQADIVKEVIEAIEQGYKIIFIRGMCGTGKSAIALNLARKLGKTSIVVPVKSLQEQYIQDYSGKKYVLKNDKKLNIRSIVGRANFKCKFLEDSEIKILKKDKEKNTKLNNIFTGVKPVFHQTMNHSCDNEYLPCKIEIKERNLSQLKEYIKKNQDIKLGNFSSVNDIKRISIAPVCPYWSPIIPEEVEIKKFKDAKKMNYQ